MNLLFIQNLLPKLPVHAHHEAWTAVTALGTKEMVESFLNDVVANLSIANTFYSRYIPTIARHDGNKALKIKKIYNC